MINSVFAEVTALSKTHFINDFRSSVRYTKIAMASAYTTATHEASVGVNKPAVNPLKMISGVIIDKMERENSIINFFILKRSRG